MTAKQLPYFLHNDVHFWSTDINIAYAHVSGRYPKQSHKAIIGAYVDKVVPPNKMGIEHKKIAIWWYHYTSVIRITLYWYRIVLSKRPWALAAQAPKIEGGRLHGEDVWMVQLSPCKGPLRMRSKLPGCTASLLCALSRPARQWRKLYRATKLTDLQLHCQVSAAFSCCSQYANFVLQGNNAANEATDGCVRTFDAWCRGIQSAIAAMWAQRIYLNSDSICKNLAW